MAYACASQIDSTFAAATCMSGSASHKKVCIIGAGVAGLAAAARLAAKGFQVSLFDKNAEPGGKIGLLKSGEYSFDTGPSLFTQPYLLEQLFADCGKNLHDYFSYQKLDISTHYYWQDGTFFRCFTDHGLLANEIEIKLGADPIPTLKHLQNCREAYEAIGSIFLNEPIHEWRTWASPRILKALQKLKPAYLTQTMHQYHNRVLNHPKLVQLFDRFATYNGSEAKRAPAMLSMIAHLEMNEGAFYPKGGMISIPKALHQLCKDLGVQCFFNSEVTRIFHSKNLIKGIEAAGEKIAADFVIAAGDVYHVYDRLLRDELGFQRLTKQELSSTAYVFYWGIKKVFPQLHLHNIFFSENEKAAPNVYVNITSKMEPGVHAPIGKENWFVMLVCDSTKKPPEPEKYFREAALNQINASLQTNLEAFIETENALTPSLIAKQTFAYKGTLYGASSNSLNAAFRRHSNRHPNIENLFFAGGTVHPGGGIPLCLRSGKLVSELVDACHWKNI